MFFTCFVDEVLLFSPGAPFWTVPNSLMDMFLFNYLEAYVFHHREAGFFNKT